MHKYTDKAGTTMVSEKKTLAPQPPGQLLHTDTRGLQGNSIM